MTKIILTGVTGLVGTEALRQALSNPSVTSVIALARKPVEVPEGVKEGADLGKFKSVVVEDFGKEWSEEVKEVCRGAGGCVWNLAITPTKSKGMPSEEVRRVCLDYTITGLESLAPIAASPFRFIYTSGSMTERDQSKKPSFSAEYRLMRGEVENRVLAFAAKNKKVEPCVMRPGIINSPGGRSYAVQAFIDATSWVGAVPQVHVREIAAAMIEQVVGGVEAETLENEGIVRVGREVLGREGEL